MKGLYKIATTYTHTNTHREVCIYTQTTKYTCIEHTVDVV